MKSIIIKRKFGWWFGVALSQKITVNGYENIKLSNGAKKEISIPEYCNEIDIDVKHVGYVGEFKIKRAQEIKYILLKTGFSDVTCIVTYLNGHTVELINKKSGINKIIWVIGFLFILFLLIKSFNNY